MLEELINDSSTPPILISVYQGYKSIIEKFIDQITKGKRETEEILKSIIKCNDDISKIIQGAVEKPYEMDPEIQKQLISQG
jgi:uncharacterized alpha/beta hydrolase family protein